MYSCDHDSSIVVYLGRTTTCPLCAAKEEIAEHEKSNAALVEYVNNKIETIEDLKIEIRYFQEQLASKED